MDRIAAARQDDGAAVAGNGQAPAGAIEDDDLGFTGGDVLIDFDRGGPKDQRSSLPFGEPERRAAVLTSQLAVRDLASPCTCDAGQPQHCRDEKTIPDIQTFPGRTKSGIRQELFAILILTVVARMLVLIPDAEHCAGAASPFKHAMVTLAEGAFVLTPRYPQQALQIFGEVLSELAGVRDCPPSTPQPSQPRVSRKAMCKWQVDKAKRAATD